MQIIIIGDGAAGNAAAQKIRSLDKDVKVTMISSEATSYYSRPRLPEFICGKTPEEKLIIHQSTWYTEQDIDLKLATEIIEIDPINKTIKSSNNQTFNYDKLLLAVGSTPNKPAISGVNLENVFVLRTLEDAKKIKMAVQGKSEIVAIGGGLLGLEVVDCLADGTRDIKVIEHGQYLLSRQLNELQAKHLQDLLEDKNYQFYLAEDSAEITKENNCLTVTTKSEKKISGDLILLSCGVSANLNLAKSANLKTDRGIIVNNFLKTSDPNIYAAGDCIQIEQTMWGFVKSSMEQGQIAAENMVNDYQTEYLGTKIEPTLKIAGIDLKNL